MPSMNMGSWLYPFRWTSLYGQDQHFKSCCICCLYLFAEIAKAKCHRRKWIVLGGYQSEVKVSGPFEDCKWPISFKHIIWLWVVCWQTIGIAWLIEASPWSLPSLSHGVLSVWVRIRPCVQGFLFCKDTSHWDILNDLILTGSSSETLFPNKVILTSTSGQEFSNV